MIKKLKKGLVMKKTTLFLLTTLSICTSIKSMEMDIEERNNYTPSNTSESSSTISTKSKSNNSNNNDSQTDKLLKQNNALLKDLVVLTHTNIMQDKIHFEYLDNKQHATTIPIDRHAKDAQTALDNTYKSTNAQLKNKALHIPMTGATVATTAQTTKNSKIEDFV